MYKDIELSYSEVLTTPGGPIVLPILGAVHFRRPNLSTSEACVDGGRGECATHSLSVRGFAFVHRKKKKMSTGDCELDWKWVTKTNIFTRYKFQQFLIARNTVL